MKCNIASCNPFDDIHPTRFGPAPPLPPTSALVRILFAKLNSLKGVAIPQVAQRISNFVGAAPSDDSIVDACRDECSNETLDWIAGHVWHKRPRWNQKACSAAAEGSSQRVIDWVNAQVTPTGPEPLIVAQAVVAAKLGETRADKQTMLQVAQKISGHLVRLSENRIWVEIAHKHPLIDQVERMVSQLPERTTRSTYFHLLDACVQSGHTHLVKWAWTHIQPRVDDQDQIQDILIPILSSNFLEDRPDVSDTCSLLVKSCSDTLTSVGENFLSLLRKSVETGTCEAVTWTWGEFEDPAAYRLEIFMMIVSIVSSETLEEEDSAMDDTCQHVFSLSNDSLELAEYQIRILSRDGHYKALKWFIDCGMTWEYDLVFEFETSVMEECEPVVRLLLGVIACPCFRYRLLDQLDMIRSSERRNLVEEYANAPDIVDKLCAVIVNMSGFALMGNVLKSFHERTPPSPLVPEIEKALAMQAARSNNLEFVRFAYRVLSSTICGEVLRPECTAHGNEEILSWLERH